MPPSTENMDSHRRRPKLAPGDSIKLPVPEVLEAHFGMIPYSNEANYGVALVSGIPFLDYCEALAWAWAWTGQAPSESAVVYKTCAQHASFLLYDPFDIGDAEWNGMARKCAESLLKNRWHPDHPYVSFCQMISERQGLGDGGDFKSRVADLWLQLVEAEAEADCDEE